MHARIAALLPLILSSAAFAQGVGNCSTLAADTSAARESRISIRGSGLNAGFERRGLTPGWQLNRQVRLFGSAENLFDTRYISNVSTTANQARENAAAFTPGQGRALFAGASASF